MLRLPLPSLLLAAALCLAGSGCTATRVAQDSWTVTRSRNFRLVSNAGEAKSAEVVQELEKFRAVMLSVSGGASAGLGEPLTVYAFHSRASFEPFITYRYVTGFFVSELSGRYAAIDLSHELSRQTLFHEYVHAVLASSGTLYPHWYQEGLAEYLETVRFQPDFVELGHLPQRRELMQLIRPGYDRKTTGSHVQRRLEEVEEASLFYAQSWALVDMLSVGHLTKRGGKDRREALAHFLTLWNAGEGGAAYHKAFGVSGQQLFEEMEAYAQRQDFPLIRLPLSTGKQAAAVKSTPLPTEDVAMELAHVSRDNGQYAQARALYALALEKRPGHLEARVGTAACLSPLGQHAEAEALFAALAREAPDHPFLTAQRTRHLLHRLALGEEARQGRAVVDGRPVPFDAAAQAALVAELAPARERLQQTLAAHPDDAELLALYGATFRFGPAGADLKPAIAALDRAVLKAPSSTEANQWLAELLITAGEREGARMYLQRIIGVSHGSEAGHRAAALLQTLEDKAEARTTE